MVAHATRSAHAVESGADGRGTSREHSLGVVTIPPARAAAVAKGLKRLGLSERERRYFDLHAVLDVAHSKAWNAEALIPIVSERPDVARFIAEGALMRLACGERCFAAYRVQLWSSERLAASGNLVHRHANKKGRRSRDRRPNSVRPDQYGS